MTKNNINTGKVGEELAHKFLIQNGFQIIRLNYRFSRTEIDIIALKDKVLHFIEVKTRRNYNYGNPIEAVNQKKMKNIYETAEMFLVENEYKEYNCQVDVISVVLQKGKDPLIEHYENVYYN